MHDSSRCDAISDLLSKGHHGLQMANKRERERERERETFVLSPKTFTEDVYGHNWLFSGVARDNSQLLVGDRDVRLKTTDITLLREALGDFSLVVQHADGSLDFSSDFFGFERIYYCNRDGVFAAANNYHLLLLVLRDLGIHMTLNRGKVIANLVSVSGQINQTNFSWDMDVEGVKELPVDQYIHISRTGVSFVNTRLYDIVREPKPFDPMEYERLIYAARDEVIDNVRVCFEHPDFEHVQVDLSGGLDSRIVYGATLNLPPRYGRKQRIRTASWPPNNAEVAATVNNIFGLKFDDLETVSSQDWISCMLDAYQSVYMGTYFGKVHWQETSRVPHTVRLGGYAGAIYRPYYSSKVHAVDDYLSFFGPSKASTVLFNGVEGYREQLESFFAASPGRSFEEQFMNHYLYFRNGHHFNSRFTASSVCPSFAPLQSRSLFLARQSRYSRRLDGKCLFDLLDALNPVLATVPFSEQQGEERASLQNELLLASRFHLEASFNPSQASLESARLEKDTHRVFYPDIDTIRTSTKRVSDAVYCKDATQEAFDRILSSTQIFTEEEISIIQTKIGQYDDMHPWLSSCLTMKLLSIKHEVEIID